jgi:hypothetical protein
MEVLRMRMLKVPIGRCWMLKMAVERQIHDLSDPVGAGLLAKAA